MVIFFVDISDPFTLKVKDRIKIRCYISGIASEVIGIKLL